MRRLACLAAAAFSAALGLLTILPSPDWLSWKLSVVAGQFGYMVAAVPLLAAWAAWRPALGRGPFAVATLALSGVAVVLLVQPCFQAWFIARSLPARMDREFGPGRESSRAFTFTGLLRPWPAAVPMRTLAYAGPLKLDFYPAFGRAQAPCVIVIHGGGWNDGDRGQLPQFNAWLAREGYAVADISYRLAPKSVWPAQREDVAAAIAFLKSASASLGIDPSRLVLLGRSAGGQIAEACAYSLRDPSVRGVVALYAPADMRFAWLWGRPDDVLNSLELLREFLGGTPETAGPAFDSASGYLLAARGSPPTLQVHGTIDTLVWSRQSERLSARLSELGVPNLLLTLPWATHALEFNLSGPSGQLASFAVRRFLDSVCR